MARPRSPAATATASTSCRWCPRRRWRCSRARGFGAVHSVVFGGFSPDAQRDRILDADYRVVVTADEGPRGGCRRRTGCRCVPVALTSGIRRFHTGFRTLRSKSVQQEPDCRFPRGSRRSRSRATADSDAESVRTSSAATSGVAYRGIRWASRLTRSVGPRAIRGSRHERSGRIHP